MNEAQQERFADALIRLDGDQEMLKALAAMAAEDAPPLLRNVEDAIESNDLQSVERDAHVLKGLLGTFEIGEPVSGLQVLIDAARHQKVDVVRMDFNKLRPQILELITEIKSLAS